MVDSYPQFISAAALEEIHSSVLILDASFDPSTDQRTAYNEKHIAGAIYLDLANLKDLNSPYAYMLPKKDQIVPHLSNLGVGLDNKIVVYDRAGNLWATRAAFVLRAWGFENVKVLDGGLNIWGERPTESGESKKGNGTNFNFVFHPELVATYEDIQAITSG